MKTLLLQSGMRLAGVVLATMPKSKLCLRARASHHGSEHMCA